jgi:hypothetical protein
VYSGRLAGRQVRCQLVGGQTGRRQAELNFSAKADNILFMFPICLSVLTYCCKIIPLITL